MTRFGYLLNMSRTLRAAVVAALLGAVTLAGCDDGSSSSQAPDSVTDAGEVKGADLGAPTAPDAPVADESTDDTAAAEGAAQAEALLAEAQETADAAEDAATTAEAVAATETQAEADAQPKPAEAGDTQASAETTETVAAADSKPAPTGRRAPARSGGSGAPGALGNQSFNQELPDGALLPEQMPAIETPEVEGYRSITFDLLSKFDFNPELAEAAEEAKEAGETLVDGEGNVTAPGEKVGGDELVISRNEDIPADIKALEGEKVAIAGFMIPVTFRQGRTNEFILTKVIPSCFFCQPPLLNDWVEVKAKKDEWFDYPGDDPIVVTGTLSVGAVYEDGFPVSFYRMVVDDIEKFQPAEQ